MIWFRIDNRLIHGQVVEAWVPYVKASCVLVANDALAGDALRQQILLLAVPARIRTVFAKVEALHSLMKNSDARHENVIVLFQDCADARRAFDAGVTFPCCNVGNLHYGEGKRQVSPHVALSPEDERDLRYFESRHVTLDFRSIPADVNTQLKNW